MLLPERQYLHMEQSDVSDTACKRSAACGNSYPTILCLKGKTRVFSPAFQAVFIGCSFPQVVDLRL
ncbi:hypothetical protein D0T49_06555 [Paludibacter sp. 221]|nr:hypothetical protein [Paludibacter sp. 221]